MMPRFPLPVAAAALSAALAAVPVIAQDKPFAFDFGGRLQNDWTWVLSADDAIDGDLDDGVEFRRARVFLSGTVYERVAFKLQVDFADGDPELKDVYIALTKLPAVGKVQVGHFLEPFSLDILTSSRFITFLERGLPTAFAPARNTGIMMQNRHADDRLWWAVGWFRDTDDQGRNLLGEVSSEDSHLTARIAGLPVDREQGRRLVHLGAAVSLQDREERGVRFRARPEVHLATRFVDTGSLAADGADLLGLEAALVHGPLSVQGEYIQADIDGAGSPTFAGYYVFASYIITGEHRPYSRSKGAFSRLKPKRNFLSGEGGPGAWEVALRYSELDLDDGAVRGGVLEDLTLALNWYLNPRTRVMLDLVSAERAGDFSADFASIRFQVDF